MGIETGIEWCRSTFNPWWGCTKVSPACDHCYAESGSNRYGFSIWGKDAPRRFFGDAHWNEPLKWNRLAAVTGEPWRVFAGSYCDVMEDRRDLDPFRERLYKVIEQTPNLDWLLVSKRPQNFRRFLPKAWIDSPRSNVWLLTTVESGEYLWRIDALKTCPAVVHGLSIEPLLEDLSGIGDHLDDVEWCICGGESGTSRALIRGMQPDWARRIRDESLGRGIPFFFKQWGNFAPAESGLVFVRSKKEGGCELDGIEWKQVPSIAPAEKKGLKES